MGWKLHLLIRFSDWDFHHLVMTARVLFFSEKAQTLNNSSFSSDSSADWRKQQHRCYTQNPKVSHKYQCGLRTNLLHWKFWIKRMSQWFGAACPEMTPCWYVGHHQKLCARKPTLTTACLAKLSWWQPHWNSKFRWREINHLATQAVRPTSSLEGPKLLYLHGIMDNLGQAFLHQEVRRADVPWMSRG